MKKFLLALDLSPHSRRAAEALAGVAGFIPDSEVLLLAVISRWPSTVKPGLADAPLPTPGEVHGDEDAQSELAQAQAMLKEISQLFTDHGVGEERLRRLLKPQERGVAKDVLELAASEGCDTIVIGRRNLSKVQSLLLGSVSAAIVQQATGRSVWVVE
jgi:nucleotide-binding universal stress UspA family protein